jgi:hypothetical protein
MIYFAVAQADSRSKRFEYVKAGHIKIGTSVNVPARVGCMGSSHGVYAKLLATMPGSYEQERTIHRLLRHYAVKPRSEWFHPTPDVRNYIRANATAWDDSTRPVNRSFPISQEMLAALKHRASQEGTNVSELIEKAIASYLATPTEVNQCSA